MSLQGYFPCCSIGFVYHILHLTFPSYILMGVEKFPCTGQPQSLPKKPCFQNGKEREKEEKEEMFLPYCSLIVFVSQVRRTLD